MTFRRALAFAAILVLLGGLGVVWWMWRQGLVTKGATQPTPRQTAQPAAAAEPDAAVKERPAGVTEIRSAIPASDPATAMTPPQRRTGAAPRVTAAAGAEAPPAKPIPVAWQPASVQEGRVRVWSLEPVADGLIPPEPLMREEWRDAVLTRTGGAVLLKDRTVAVWHESSPNIAAKFSFREGAADLQGTPDEALVRCRNGAVYALPPGGSGTPRLIAEQMRALYPSAQPGRLPAFDAESQMVILDVAGPGSHTALPARWRASHEPAAMTADGKLWTVSGLAELWLLPADGGAFELGDEGPISDIKPMGTALVAIETNRQELIAFNGGAPPPAGFAARRLLAVEGIALATNDNGAGVMWGSRVPDSPRSFNLPDGVWQVRLSPAGLIVAW